MDRLRFLLAFLVAWIEWTALFGGGPFIAATLLGAVWTGWFPVLALFADASILAFGLTLYCVSERRAAA